MKSLTIKKGETESTPIVLGHMKLGAIFIPATEDINYIIEILGSHDGISYGSINDGLKFHTQPRYSVQTFDPQIFDGTQFVKFTCEPTTHDLEFFIHLKDS